MTNILDGQTGPGAVKEVKHGAFKVEIEDILGADGKSIKTNFDPRKQTERGKDCTIKYKMDHDSSAKMMSVDIYFSTDGNDVAKKYYGAFAAKLHPSGLVDKLSGEIPWDGRGDDSGRRLLLQGKYKIQIEAQCLECGKKAENEHSMEVAEPYAHGYGGKYEEEKQYGKDPSIWDAIVRKFGGKDKRQYYMWGLDSDSMVTLVRSELKNLGDGSLFQTFGHWTDSTSVATTALQEESSVWWWEGHGAPGVITFCTDKKTVTALTAKDIKALPKDELNDVFLVVLNGCNTFNSPGWFSSSMPDALVARGVDVVIGFRKSVHDRAGQIWTKDFIAEVKNGISLGKAAKHAVSMVKAGPGRESVKSFKFKVGGGASPSEKMRPARYGRKKS